MGMDEDFRRLLEELGAEAVVEVISRVLLSTSHGAEPEPPP